MIRVTASMLEKYRRFRTDEYTTYDDMCDAIRGTFTPTEDMNIGTAVHSIIERPELYRDAFGGFTYGDMRFNPESIERARDFITSMWLLEVPASRVVMVDGVEVELRVKADAVFGLTVVDHKVTAKQIDERKIESYHHSMQWRAYLWAFHAEHFMYHAMQWKPVDNVLTMVDRQIIPTSRYAGLGAEVTEAVRDLYRFCVANDLTRHLVKEGDYATV